MMMYPSLHCMQKDYSAYLTNASSCDTAPTADLIYYKVPALLKKQSLTRCPIIPLMQKRSVYKRGRELQIQLLAVLALL